MNFLFSWAVPTAFVLHVCNIWKRDGDMYQLSTHNWYPSPRKPPVSIKWNTTFVEEDMLPHSCPVYTLYLGWYWHRACRLSTRTSPSCLGCRSCKLVAHGISTTTHQWRSPALGHVKRMWNYIAIIISHFPLHFWLQHQFLSFFFLYNNVFLSLFDDKSPTLSPFLTSTPVSLFDYNSPTLFSLYYVKSR